MFPCVPIGSSGGLHHGMCTEVREQLQESTLSFHHVDPRDDTQAMGSASSSKSYPTDLPIIEFLKALFPQKKFKHIFVCLLTIQTKIIGPATLLTIKETVRLYSVA